MPLRTDTELVVAMAVGDRTALGVFYDRYVGLLMAIGVRMLGDRREAEDVAQDVFLETWRAAGTYDPNRAPARTWLIMRMRSRALDRRKSAAVSRRVPLDPVKVERLLATEDPTLTADRDRVRRALAALPAEQRLVLELAYWEGLSSAEIAARSDIPIGTVKSRVAAALGKLRDGLGVGES